MSARGTLTVTSRAEFCTAANLGFWPAPHGMAGAESTVSGSWSPRSGRGN